MWKRLTRLLGLSDPEQEAAQHRALRADFRRRCSWFRQLIGANNQALETMSEMEELLRGLRPFGLPQVRGQCAQVTAGVFRMVRCLQSMTDGRYPGLFERLRAIQAEIGRHVEGSRQPASGPLILPLEQVRASDAGETGPKMANLGELAHLGLPVPPGFVVTASGFRRFFQEAGLDAEIEQLIRRSRTDRLDERYALSSAIQQRIIEAPLPDDLARLMEDHSREMCDSLGDGLRLALRSSALGEDLPDASFAGQYRTELGVRPDQVTRVYKEIVASKYGVTAMTYRWNRGIPDEGMAVCVGCLAMIAASAGGVVYTVDPFDPGSDRLVIHASPGLPMSVVEGEGQADRFLVSRADPPRLLECHIPTKRSKAVMDTEEGIRHVPLAGRAALSPSLDEPTALELARHALAVEQHFGGPQDVEWVLDKEGKLLFLQARPITSHEAGGGTPPGQPLPDIPALLEGGEPASPGAACGPVFVARKNADAFRFPEGGVLVTAQALPRWAPLLSKAAAVVSETGSAAGHLANVAREFGVPAVFGLEGALAVLENAGEVTVDGGHGRVHAGRAEELLARQAVERPRLMLGSPVYAALSGAAEHIVPLTLLDPESPDFEPDNCRTLHDITRFCHEKSVGELFAADSGPLRNRLAKQLRYKGNPLKYWIIDLGGGFSEAPRGKYIDYHNILSHPLKVLWGGMIAKEWGGPPGLNVKGFAAVVSQAAANPALEPALASSFEVKNYFMITDSFLSLQSRFGFHFCTLEALMGDVPQENYVSFRFKGGAADMERRVLRAELVADLLEEHGFRTELKEDALVARAEGLDRKDLEDRLRILGYVMIHTRQLDMVMKDPRSAEGYAARLRGELQNLLAPGNPPARDGLEYETEQKESPC